MDENLDWYNIRKELYDTMVKGAEKLGFISSLSNREEFIKNQFEILLHTNSSWQQSKSTFKL